jgi:hypothetical protein
VYWFLLRVGTQQRQSPELGKFIAGFGIKKGKLVPSLEAILLKHIFHCSF